VMSLDQPGITQDKYIFSGPQPGYKDSKTRTKGIMKRRREQKRREAMVRNAETSAKELIEEDVNL